MLTVKGILYDDRGVFAYGTYRKEGGTSEETAHPEQLPSSSLFDYLGIDEVRG